MSDGYTLADLERMRADEEFKEYLDVRAERRENQLLPDFSVERISYG